MATNKIWITWETQRRSLTLARHLGCKLFIFDIEGFFRYPLCLLKTLFTLLIHRPRFLFVQNPSIVLAAFSCLYCSITGTKLIVDRHSNFRLNKPRSGSLPIWLFMRFHYYSLKHADITIVTNNYLAHLVKKAGGQATILPDKLPEFPIRCADDHKENTRLLLISSFGSDEPVQEVIEAFTMLNNKNCELFITGNFKKRLSEIPAHLPPSLHLTGFIPDTQYKNLLTSSDIVLVLTRADYCMLCGCYEAVAAEKPLITSDKQVLREYFSLAVFVDNHSESILSGIIKVLENPDYYRKKISVMKLEIEKKWNSHFSALNTVLHKFDQFSKTTTGENRDFVRF